MRQTHSKSVTVSPAKHKMATEGLMSRVVFEGSAMDDFEIQDVSTGVQKKRAALMYDT